ncbi:methyltransferase domain-containing protein [Streptosporangium sp. NPDC020072]|uniref:class I SAM-dependent methyltransferase n=1 Tax=Streptosporangium sp. NPDC020072 TaxID=3154788 RepID=UPI0034449C5D
MAPHVADPRERLPFDDVIASPVPHHLGDRGPAPAELRRVLRPGGRLIASTTPSGPTRSRAPGPTTSRPPATPSTGRSAGGPSRWGSGANRCTR